VKDKPRVKAFFIDIDGTLTDGADPHPYAKTTTIWSNPNFGVICDALAAKEGIRFDEAAERLRKVADKIVWWDYPHFVAEFQLDARPIWDRILELQQDFLMAYADGEQMVKKLKRRGFRLYIVSNNPTFGCLLKLHRLGLADPTGTPWFDRLLGADIIRGQKSQPGHWYKALAHSNYRGEEVVVIGDNPREDGEVPLAAGLGYAVIVRRDQRDKVMRNGRLFSVRSLDLVPGLFELDERGD